MSMKKLLIILAVLVVIAAGLLGYLGYQMTHIFVDGIAYAKNLTSLDLQGEDISIAHYDALRAQLPNCEILWDVPIQNGTAPNDTDELTLKGLNQQDLDRMRYFTGLKTITVTDCTDYALLEQLQKKLPQARVEYTVDLGGSEHDHSAESLTLAEGEYTLEMLTVNLPYLPGVTEITFPKTGLTSAELAGLRETFPEITFACTVELLGQELDSETTELDLTAMNGDQVEQVAQELTMLSSLESVQLSDELTMEQVKVLKDANPDVNFRYTFQLLGKTFTTDDEEILFKNNWKIKDDAIPQLRLALDIMNNCKRLCLDNTGVTSVPMSQMREDYRGKTEVVWRVWFGEGGSALTDVEVLRIVYGLRDANCENLKYLEKVRYVDIGHSDFLFTCDFVSYMPELEAMIIGGSHISDLTPFANCPELKFLEMGYCSRVVDLESLRNCTKLEMLNIFGSGVTDLSPIEDLPLTHLCIKMTKITEEDRLLYEEAHPDCWVTYKGDVPYGEGWRTVEGNTKTEWYAKINEIFGYTKSVVQNNTGWYLS